MAKKELVTITPEGLNLLTVMNYANIAEMNGFYGKEIYFTKEFEGDTQYLFQALGNLGAYARDKNLDSDISFIIIANKIVDEGENTHFIEFSKDFANKLNQNNSPYKRIKLISEEQLIKYIENRAKNTSDDLTKDLVQKYIKSKKAKEGQPSGNIFPDLFPVDNLLITIERFKEIDSEVKNAINAAFDCIKEISLEKYTLLLSRADYMKLLLRMPNMSPYVVDDRRDVNFDMTRLNFLGQFLNTFYSFAKVDDSIQENEARFNLELMVYSHIWESDNFLKTLHRVAQLINGKDYVWKVEIPMFEKSKFIREIRETFEKQNNNLSTIMSKTYNSTIRNSFTHSQYSITMRDKKIEFKNNSTEKKGWELDNISFKDWCERFVYSSLLSYYAIKIHNDRRKTFEEDTQVNKVLINRPNKSGNGTNSIYVIYEKIIIKGIEDVKFNYSKE